MLLKTLCVIALTFVGVHTYAQNEDSVLITSLYEDTPKVYTTTQKERHSGINVIKANLGIGWYTSELADNYEKKKGVSNTSFALSYLHCWESGFGLGFSYYKATGSWHGDVKLDFVGPVFAYAGESENGRWFVETSIGLGYGNLAWGENKITGLGGLIAIGCTYKLTKYFGVGIDVNCGTVRNGTDSDNNPIGGESLNITLGPRFFF